MASVFVGLCTLTSPTLAVLECELVAVGILAVVSNAVIKKPLTQYVDRYDQQKMKETCQLIVNTVAEQVKDDGSPIREMFSVRERASVTTRFVYTVPAFE